MYTYSVECLVDRVLSPCRRYTRFGIGPFESGHAITVANNLRRGLLDGVPGWSVTGARLKGARHEFSALSGVRESALEVLMNLREGVLTGPPPNRNNQKFVGTLNALGPSQVTLGQINFPYGVSAVNPDQHVAHLASSATLDATIKFEFTNRGKDPFISTLSSEEQSGFITVQPVAFPVKRVSFSIRMEPHPVTQIEVEYVFLEMLTDNSIHPQRALIIGAQYVIDLMWPIGGRRLRVGY
uniref:Plastid-encoded RNA polymerase subunit alpha n=1 Tax=Chloroparvula japonica TaxID=1411623 RepID=A0A4D6C5J2_9CHLO|nr:alpha subunit of RNA polymerase [Chloroparvula japonica]QBX98143.1 alpha subunit of RNA polymerase [Chloroparvula japonica]